MTSSHKKAQIQLSVMSEPPTAGKHKNNQLTFNLILEEGTIRTGPSSQEINVYSSPIFNYLCQIKNNNSLLFS